MKLICVTEDDIDPTQLFDEDEAIAASIMESSLLEMEKSPNIVVGTKYAEDVVKTYQPGLECTICFEEFREGEAIARMDCFCTFHKRCIDKYVPLFLHTPNPIKMV